LIYITNKYQAHCPYSILSSRRTTTWVIFQT